MKFEVSKDVLAQYDKGSFKTEDYVEGVKAIVPLTNLMDKDNQCFDAPKCRLQFVSHLQAAQSVRLYCLRPYERQFQLSINTFRQRTSVQPEPMVLSCRCMVNVKVNPQP